jgi:hypothetical protein
VVAVPLFFRLHGLPSDYWRFTAGGLYALLAPFAHRTVFALGPRLKPTLVFAVASKPGAAPAFATQSDQFQALVHSVFRSQRLRGYWGELDQRARDFFGCLLGRAELATVFVDPDTRAKYLPDAGAEPLREAT